MVEDGDFSHKIDYATIFYANLNHKGHPNQISGLIVTEILLNNKILRNGGVASGRVCAEPEKQACSYIHILKSCILETTKPLDIWDNSA